MKYLATYEVSRVLYYKNKLEEIDEIIESLEYLSEEGYWERRVGYTEAQKIWKELFLGLETAREELYLKYPETDRTEPTNKRYYERDGLPVTYDKNGNLNEQIREIIW